MLYEVFIPTVSQDGYNVTQKVDADHWIAALRSGLAKMGEQGDIVKGVMCDIQPDGSMHVTDPKSGRVFKIREIGASAEGAAEQAPTTAMPSATPDPGVARDDLAHEATAAGVPVAEDAATIAIPKVVKDPSWRDLTSAPIQTGQHPTVSQDPEARLVEVTEERATDESLAFARRDVQDPEEVLADVFEEAANIYDFGEDIQGAVEFVMDLVMAKVSVEAGSILFANINENDLYFASARGPKAEEVMGFRVPMGKGIVGFCAKEGQALALSNASRSPLFFKRIAESIGYPARSIACAPVEHDGRSYGAIEILNKQGNDEISAGELEVIKYLGARLAEHVNNVIMANA